MFGEVRDKHSDEDSEGEEANVGCTLTANVSGNMTFSKNVNSIFFFNVLLISFIYLFGLLHCKNFLFLLV